MAMTQASSPVEWLLEPRSGPTYRQPQEPQFYRAPVIVSRPGSAMTRPNGIVAGTPRERFDLDVARGNLACSALAFTMQCGDTTLDGEEAGF